MGRHSNGQCERKECRGQPLAAEVGRQTGADEHVAEVPDRVGRV
jgi:hypothetical protein